MAKSPREIGTPSRKNIANPTALLLSGIFMLRHLGLMENAAIIENALLYTLESGVHTGDFGDRSKASVNTTEFANAIMKFSLVNVSNRGTQVWPTGSVFTNLVNQYNVRFEALDDQPLKQQDVIGLYVSLSGYFKICSFELLNSWGGKKAYSLAQGQ